MNIKRITSALLGFPIVVLILLIGNKYIVDIAIAIIAIFAIDEYFHAVSKVSKPVKWVGYLSCISIAFIHVIPEYYLNIVITIAIPTIIMLLFAQIIITDMRTNFGDIAYTFIGIFYIAFFMMFIAFINGMPNGKILIWYPLFAAWGTDLFAYIVGKVFGKHKFSKVSPKKSIEGCIAGVIGSVIMMLGYTLVANTYWNMDFSYIYIIGIGVILSLVGQIGDFSASAIKRFIKIKDYSNLIPGHGGMLDRIDSLLFLAPFAYALLVML